MANPQQYLNNPNVRKMLDVIASAEGVKYGYNTIFGNERFGNLSAHPNVRKQFKQTDGTMNVTTAAGRYQFLKPTWDDASKRYGLKDFSPQSQDVAAIGLLMQNGALPYVLKGDYRTAVQKSGGTWASLPSSPYAQPKRSQAEIDKFLGGSSSQPQRLQTVSWKEISGQSAKSSRPELVRFDSIQQPQRPQTVKFSEIAGEQPQTDSRPALVAWNDIAGG
jgi:muramidase (phage lysozyme)